MRILTNYLLVLVAATSILLVATSPAAGQRRWSRVRHVRTWRATTDVTRSPPRRSSDRNRNARYYYPQYTGAFHARYFDEIPSLYGTRPIRGTAW
jgi:hypothetical protein